MAFWSALFSKSTPTPLHSRPSLTLYFLLTGTFLLTLVPHVIQFPIWLSVCIVAALVIRSVIEVYRLPLPSTTFCGIMAVFLLGIIMLQFSTVLGRDAGTALTAGLLTIKFYELRLPRDIALIIFSCFFMVMSALLYSQALELFIYCLIMMWVLTALLLRNQMGDLPVDRLLRMLHRSGIIFLQAMPLTLFLFFFFPRYTGKLQVILPGTPIGFTDTVRPGDIAEISRDDSEAMYVRFSGNFNPAVETLYWRGLTLWRYEHGAWTTGAISAVPEPPARDAEGSDHISQTITIYPHNQRWLFALDTPISKALNSAEQPAWSSTYTGHVIQLSGLGDKLDHMERYQVFSSLSLAQETLTPREREAALRLPLNEIGAPVQALKDKLHQEYPETQAYVRAILHYFRHEHFTYSPSPGADHGDWLTDFLFVNKTGFCEHFASAFAVLTRLDGIPTRVVVGYQGAEYNPYNDTYIVRQSDAHAWDEVWVDAKNSPAGSNEGRWLRVDPTAILGPGQEPPETAANSPDQQNSGENLSIQIARHRLSFSETYFPGWMRRALTEVELRRDQVETAWDDWVFSYDPDAQERLAQAMGFGQEAHFVLLVASLGAVVLCAFLTQKWLKRKPPPPPVEILYTQFCRNMAQRGIPRAAWEGPLAYTSRVADVFPEKEKAIRDVGSIVSLSRYGPEPPDPSMPRELKSLLQLITASQAASSSRERS